MKGGVWPAALFLLGSFVGFCHELLVWFLGYRVPAFSTEAITAADNPTEFYAHHALYLSLAVVLAVFGVLSFLKGRRDNQRKTE